MIERSSLLNEVRQMLTETADGIYEVVCDELCRWPHECRDEESLWEDHCEKCPLKRYL